MLTLESLMNGVKSSSFLHDFQSIVVSCCCRNKNHCHCIRCYGCSVYLDHHKRLCLCFQYWRIHLEVSLLSWFPVLGLRYFLIVSFSYCSNLYCCWVLLIECCYCVPQTPVIHTVRPISLVLWISYRECCPVV